MRVILFILLGWATIASTTVYSQSKGSISGKVTDKGNQEPLIGASITYAPGKGVVTDIDGNFSIDLNHGSYTFTISYVGYEAMEKTVEHNRPVTALSLEMTTTTLDEVKIVGNVAVGRETPVAFTNISPKKIQEELGTQDLPMLLNTTPGVYATQQGGGDGDTRINIRGFNQRNIGVMIDGVPVNDMENGWVYWSNWFGLDAVTRNVQVQRGLGSSKMAIPSVGGTMNILTNGIDQKRFLKVKQDYTFGEGIFAAEDDESTEDLSRRSYLRTTIGYNSGRLKGNWGFTLAGAFKTGNTDAVNTPTLGGFYYVKVEKRIKSHVLSVSAFGAPQEHGQRAFKLQIEDYSKEVAREMGIDTAGAFDYGLNYNRFWGDVNRYTINSNGDTIRAEDERLLTQKNAYHKPQFTLKHSWSPNDKLLWSTTGYASLGFGGGTGTSSSFTLNSQSGQYNVQSAYDANYANGIAPSSQRLHQGLNEHQWYGALSTVNYKFHKHFNFSGGLDYRYYHGLHYRKAYDLLGGDSLVNIADQNNPNLFFFEGDIIDYNNDSFIHWGGGFAQVEFSNGFISAFVNVSAALSAYNRVDYFKAKDLVLIDTTYIQSIDHNDTIVHNGISYHTESPEARISESGWQNLPGFTAKAGVNFNLSKNHNLFVNGGYLSRAQRFSNVIHSSNRVLDNIDNEEVMAAELGYSGKFNFINYNLNGYFTRWNNRPLDRIPSTQIDGESVLGVMSGISANHIGFEVDAYASPFKWLELEGVLSIGNWTWDSEGSIKWFNEEGEQISQGNSLASTHYDARGVHVGDAAQTQGSLSVKFRPIKGLYLQIRYSHFSRYYAAFEPTDLDGSANNINEDGSSRDSWIIPSFNLVDANVGYSFEWAKKVRTSLRFGVKNLLGHNYISDADNNGVGNGHNAESAFVFFGSARTYTMSLTLTL
jgi:hypothetical protein